MPLVTALPFRFRPTSAALAGALAAVLAAGLFDGASAQQGAPKVEAAPQTVPGFWDPRRRPDRPDLSRISVIRFLTETDYPPFNFTGPDGNPAGFNVDLARSLCDEIKVTCTIQMRRFETLADALLSNRRASCRGRTRCCGKFVPNISKAGRWASSPVRRMRPI